jgi:hypothetical protein
MAEDEPKKKIFRDSRLDNIEGEDFDLKEDATRNFSTVIKDMNKLLGAEAIHVKADKTKKKSLWRKYDSDGGSLTGKSSSKLKEHLSVHENQSDDELKSREKEPESVKRSELSSSASTLSASKDSGTRYVPRGTGVRSR